MSEYEDVQRTSYVYEILNHYPKPPLISIDSFDTTKAIHNINPTKLQKKIIQYFFTLSDYKSFKADLPSKLESILRKRDNQVGALFAPVVSATISIKDDSRNLNSVERIATLLIAAKSFSSDLNNGKLEPDKYKNEILEIGQYPNCFSTTQTIYNNEASLYKSKNRSQIALIVNKKYYIIDIDNLKSDSDLADLIETIYKIRKIKVTESSKSSPGRITCARNSTQIRIFNKLTAIDENNISLRKLKNCFTILCLDSDLYPKDDVESLRLAHIDNPDNRWYHSSLQIVVFGNSKASIICNFSNSISGNVMMRVASEIQSRAEKICIVNNNTTKLLNYHELKWDIKSNYIKKAQKDLKSVLDNQTSSFTINSIGKNFFDENKVKAVPSFILALQLTINVLTKKNFRITQFVSISKYRCLDLTTAEVTTKENLKFTEVLLNTKSNFNELRKLFDSAVNSQSLKIRKARKTLKIFNQIQIYLDSTSGIKKQKIRILLVLLVISLYVTGFFKNRNREVIVSHPKIFDEVTFVGRPGVKIPYAKYFGMHYQLFPEKIVITMMPGLKWKIPNKTFISELERNLIKVKLLLDS